MKELPISNGPPAIVDDDVYEWASEFSWHLDIKGYVRRRDGYSHAFLHRQVIKPKPGMYVDHINREKRDNRRDNLRLVTPAQNCTNRSPLKKKGHSKYKGVTWNKSPGKWQAAIRVNGERTYLGFFDDEEEAARVYDAHAYAQWGEYCYLNFPDKKGKAA